VVRVVERKEDAGPARYIEYKAYRSPGDPRLILGAWQYAESVAGAKAAIATATSNLGTPVETDFRRALDYADRHAIPFVWVNDPHGLFPPSKRPPF
jgi:hypothetical protein